VNKFRTSAIAILTKAGKPLHYREITHQALEQGILETEGATPDASMNAQIVMDIKRKRKLSDFIKTAPSTYALNPNKPQIEPETEEEQEKETQLIIEGSYTGRAGEHLVCSELLFRGFNASIMSVDTGIDIAAVKENKFFGIQVKAANKNRFNTYAFHIRRSSFERHNQGNIFYIFVLRENGKNKFVILSSNDITRKISEGAIFSVNKRTGYSLSIKLRQNNIYLGNMNHEMNYYLNNWDIIK
jgi:hypothetical protein